MKKGIKDLLIDELKDILSAEEQIVKALPKMIIAAESVELKNAFRGHLKETTGQVKRLDRIFKLLKIKEKAKFCKATKGLIEECQGVIKEFGKSAVRDAALISKAQRIEHYEISAYGTLRTFAKELGLKEVAGLLQETLSEEGAADKKLTKIAEGGLFRSGINQKAIIPSDTKTKTALKRTIKKKTKKITVAKRKSPAKIHAKTIVSKRKISAKKKPVSSTAKNTTKHKTKQTSKTRLTASQKRTLLMNGKKTTHSHPKILSNSHRAKSFANQHKTATKKYFGTHVAKRPSVYAGRR